MLLEVPNIAGESVVVSPNHRPKVISKPLRRYLEYNDRNVFNGPPESTRDYVIAATKSLLNGDWKKCDEWIQGIKFWKHIPESSTVKAMLRAKICEEGLRTWLISNGLYYESMSLKTLASMFEIGEEKVYSIVSKMIYNEEIAATIDQVSSMVIFKNVQPSHLQMLTLQGMDRLESLIDEHERSFDLRQGKIDQGPSLRRKYSSNLVSPASSKSFSPMERKTFNPIR
jgi:translation initiation factor 3 subunit C